MKDFNLGLKLWSVNTNVLVEAERLIGRNIFQYIELMMVPNTEIAPFKRLKVSYVIHAPHEQFGVNIADSGKEEFNRQILSQCIQWADELQAKYIVLHAGFEEMLSARTFLKDVNDRRIVIENMPKVGMNNEDMIGATAEQIHELMGDRFGFCLDFNHAIKAAESLKKDYKEYIKEFLKVGPNMFHISDGELQNEKDEHLNIGEGEYDMEFLVSAVKKSGGKYVTMETPRTDMNSLREDAENAEKLRALMQADGGRI